MTNDEQRIAIAEACGYKRVEVPGGAYGDDGPCKPEPMTYWFEEGWNLGEEIGLPDYLSDLNAIHEAEKTRIVLKTRSDGFSMDGLYVNTLKAICIKRGGFGHYWHATAAQRAEAFLRTIGRWKPQ